MKRLDGEARAPVALAPGGEEGGVRRLLIPVRSFETQGGRLIGLACDDIDDAAERGAAVEVRRAAAQHFHRVDVGARHAAPVDPAAERVVERDAVHEDYGAARAARADAAQRDALRGRVGRAAAAPAEEAEARDLSERVVERDGGGRLQLRLRERDDARGRLPQPRLRARRRDGHTLGERRGREHDFQAQQICLNRIQPALVKREPFRANSERGGGRRRDLKPETPTRIGRAFGDDGRLVLENDFGALDGRARLVLNDALDASVRRLRRCSGTAEKKNQRTGEDADDGEGQDGRTKVTKKLTRDRMSEIIFSVPLTLSFARSTPRRCSRP